ncbi:heavy metal-binding domain-containing protein [Shewanella sp.]|uniref:heavy metal-binding domain-containing protein n=1 Tax=Shewanella sp. TaxID=50422 RepID=UPI003A96C5B5
MKLSTTAEIAGFHVTETLGIATGNVVRSKHIGRDIMAGLKTIIGGEIVGYTEMLTEARQVAIDRMLDNAKAQGADAVINVRFTTSAIMQGMSEMLAYGTAVKLVRA